jgi:hypothetical protein
MLDAWLSTRLRRVRNMVREAQALIAGSGERQPLRPDQPGAKRDDVASRSDDPPRPLVG